MKLYGFFRSSAAFRVRIALNLKGLAYDGVYIHLRRNDQAKPDYRGVNPQSLVPTLEDGGETLIQSLAIIEYLDEIHPDPPFLPQTPGERARVRALADIVACDIHPINNLRVLRYLSHSFGRSESDIAVWYNHWIEAGFQALEALLFLAPWPSYRLLAISPSVRHTPRFCQQFQVFEIIVAYHWTTPPAQA